MAKHGDLMRMQKILICGSDVFREKLKDLNRINLFFIGNTRNFFAEWVCD